MLAALDAGTPSPRTGSDRMGADKRQNATRPKNVLALAARCPVLFFLGKVGMTSLATRAQCGSIAILLPQMPEVAAMHAAIYKLAAVALPTALLFGPDAISYRIQNSGAVALITRPGVQKPHCKP